MIEIIKLLKSLFYTNDFEFQNTGMIILINTFEMF